MQTAAGVLGASKRATEQIDDVLDGRAAIGEEGAGVRGFAQFFAAAAAEGRREGDGERLGGFETDV